MKPLTPRQRQIVALMAEGRSANGIAQSLGINAQTVKNQITAVYKRLEIDAESPGFRLVAMYASGQIPAGKSAESTRTD